MADIKVSFEIYNKKSVKRLQEENPSVLPKYKISEKKDLDYNKKQINNAVTSGIIQGKSIDGIAKDLQERLETLNRNSALKAARTSVTNAQNAGTLHSMYELRDMGVEVQKEWVATLDEYTRESHAHLDGERQELDDAFSNGLQYPGDTSGDASEVWNCRCTMTSYLPKYDSQDEPRLTYEEWKAYKEATGNTAYKINASEYEKAQEWKKDNRKATTREGAKKLLEDTIGFDKLEGLEHIDDALLIENTNNLARLEAKFGVVHQSEGSFSGTKAGKDTIAYISATKTNPMAQNMCMNIDWFYDYKKLVAGEIKSIRSGYSMSVDEKYANMYSLTHEYGHMLQNLIIKKAYEAAGWTEQNPRAFVDSSKKTVKAQYKWYETIRKNKAKECFEEIVEIAKKNNPDFKLSGSLSRYGRTNYYEFFAETFAQSQLSNSGELGNAMNQWLAEKGYVK